MIPLWEAISDPVVVAVSEPDNRQRAVADALAGLADAARVSFYFGRWDAEPERITRAEGIALLDDARWFSADTEPDGQRLYYVNVEHIPDD